jgi:hypothetical protein
MSLISRSISLARNVPLLPNRLRPVNSQEVNPKSVRFRNIQCSLSNIGVRKSQEDEIGMLFAIYVFIFDFLDLKDLDIKDFFVGGV